MAIAAGQINDVDDVLFRRATTTESTNSASITTTETTVASVTASLVNGRTYKVVFDGAIDSDTAATTADCRLRETNSTGTEMQLRRANCADTSGRWPIHLEAEYTASATGNKTFVATYVRASAGGTFIRVASATIPTVLYVDYVSG